MKKFAALAAVATLAMFSVPAAFAAESSQSVRAATDAAAGTVAVNAGKMLYGSNGQRIAAVYRVTAEGNPQVILNGKLVTVPASTLTDVNGKITTSLSKQELGRAQ
jgi:hypothetical protein